MVQAARSGVQDIAKGSEAAGTSKKMELKLTQVARTSLEELKLDYENFLCQNGYATWERNHPLRQRLVNARPKTADEVAMWVKGVAMEILESEQSKLSERSGRRQNNRMIPFLLNFDPHIFCLLQRFYLPWIPAFAGMTFSTTPLVKAVIPANAGIQGR
jgi:hypothetical protein